MVSVVSSYGTYFGRLVLPLDVPPVVQFFSEPLWFLVPSPMIGMEVHQ